MLGSDEYLLLGENCWIGRKVKKAVKSVITISEKEINALKDLSNFAIWCELSNLHAHVCVYCLYKSIRQIVLISGLL